MAEQSRQPAPFSRRQAVSCAQLRHAGSRFWISTFGSWNFLSKEGRGYAISIVPQALSYRLDKGEVVMKGSNINVPAASIDVFSDGQLDHRDYVTPPEYLPDNAAIKHGRKTWSAAATCTSCSTA